MGIPSDKLLEVSKSSNGSNPTLILKSRPGSGAGNCPTRLPGCIGHRNSGAFPGGARLVFSVDVTFMGGCCAQSESRSRQLPVPGLDYPFKGARVMGAG